MTYAGGPTVLIEADGWRLLTDPTFDPAGGRFFAQDAVELCGLLNPRTIVPIGHEGWRHFSQPRSEAERVLNGSPLGIASAGCPLVSRSP